jgi:hypothetical protein
MIMFKVSFLQINTSVYYKDREPNYFELLEIENTTPTPM